MTKNSSPRRRRLLVLAAAVLVGVCLLLVSAFLLAQTQSDRLFDYARAAQRDGLRFAKDHDAEGCLRETLARAARASALPVHRRVWALATSKRFLAACTQAAAPQAAWCDAVVGAHGLDALNASPTAACERLRATPEEACFQLMGVVQFECSKATAGSAIER